MRLLTCAVALSALLVGACAKQTDESGESAEKVVTGAQTAVVTAQPFTETLEATAVVSGRPDHVANLSAPTAARITAVRAVAGQRVNKGDVLVELDQVVFRSAVNAADAALAAAEQQHARQQRLVEAGIAPRRDLELAASELAAAKANAELAHRQAELSVVRAPLRGVVTQVNAVQGATADPAMFLVQVADGSAVDLALSLPPSHAARLHIGAAVDVLGDGKGAASVGSGTLSAVGGSVDSATRAVPVRAAVARSARPLQIGETVTVRITVERRASALVVPLEALVPDGESFKVFALDSASVAHARPVEVGGRSDALAEITKGLAAGERIVTHGAYGMDDGVKVGAAAGKDEAKAEGKAGGKAAAPTPSGKAKPEDK